MKRVVYTDKWLNNVSRCTNLPIPELKAKVQRWVDKGLTVPEINQLLTALGLVSTGKVLHFVSKHGEN